LDLLEQFGTTVHFSRDQGIHDEGDEAQFCYRVISGCVRTVKLTEDGRRQVGEFHLPGEMFGLDDQDAHALAAEAVTETVVRRYPRRMVEGLIESHAALSRQMRELAFSRLRAAQTRCLLLGRATASERIAAFLLEMELRLGRRGRTFLELPMGRADMADHLGLTVETICRVLAGLKRDGTLVPGRTGVELRDHTALEDLAAPVVPALV
jgi:CRP/FNR family transcriptional regulator/CRP/FNR family nitrogen fixation transcriptional regulator